jgi:EmrB/QacA subfamily drug resistance transporter
MASGLPGQDVLVLPAPHPRRRQERLRERRLERAQQARRRQVFVVLASIQFMLMFDDTVVNVALPSIQADLDFSLARLSWIVEAYFLMFGGFLLLGGRAADVFGRRRMFLLGVILFSTSSLLAGLAWDQRVLVAARACQGLGAAIASPAGLSLVITLFTQPRERAKVLGFWASLNVLGGTAGVVLGGAVVDAVGWRSLFFVNLPVAATALTLLPVLLRRPPPPDARGFDIVGAVTVTAATTLLVFTCLETSAHGWAAPRTVIGFVVSGVLGVMFVLSQRRHPTPLVRLGFFAHRRRAAAFAIQLAVGLAVLGSFFLLSLYLQQVLGLSPARAGLAYVAVFGATVPALVVTSRQVTRIGVRPLLLTGLTFVLAGLLWLSRVPAEAHVATQVLPGMLMLGYGLGHCFITLTVSAVSGVPPREAGLVSGTLTACMQVGGAIGLSVLVTATDARAESRRAAGADAVAAQVAGIHLAFTLAAAAVACGLVLAALFIGRLVPTGPPGGPGGGPGGPGGPGGAPGGGPGGPAGARTRNGSPAPEPALSSGSR